MAPISSSFPPIHGIVADPLAGVKFTLNAFGVAGFFGGETAVNGMATVIFFVRRRWGGLYNTPGSLEIAKRYGQLASPRLFRGLFPGGTMDPSELFGLDGQPGPKFFGACSGSLFEKTGHLGHLLARMAKKEDHESISRRSEVRDPNQRITTPPTVTIVDLSRSGLTIDYIIHPSLPYTYYGFLALIPIIASFGASIGCGVIGDWWGFSSIALGVIANGWACFVLSLGKLTFQHPEPVSNAPPGDGILWAAVNGVVVIRGAERDVNAITRGRFFLQYDTPSFCPGEISWQDVLGFASSLRWPSLSLRQCVNPVEQLRKLLSTTRINANHDPQAIEMAPIQGTCQGTLRRDDHARELGGSMQRDDAKDASPVNIPQLTMHGKGPARASVDNYPDSESAAGIDDVSPTTKNDVVARRVPPPSDGASVPRAHPYEPPEMTASSSRSPPTLLAHIPALPTSPHTQPSTQPTQPSTQPTQPSPPPTLPTPLPTQPSSPSRKPNSLFISMASILLTIQFVAQLFLIPQASVFGQLMFVGTLAVSWMYNVIISSIDSEDVQTRILRDILHLDGTSEGRAKKVQKFEFGTWTAMAVFACLALRPASDPPAKEPDSTSPHSRNLSRVLGALIPNETDIWTKWKAVVGETLDSDPKCRKKPEMPTDFVDDTGFLESIIGDAQVAYVRYSEAFEPQVPGATI